MQSKNTAGHYHSCVLPALEAWQYGGAVRAAAREERERTESLHQRTRVLIGFDTLNRAYTSRERRELGKARKMDISGKTDLAYFPLGLYHHKQGLMRER